MMTDAAIAPFGAWTSEINTDAVVRGALRFGDVVIDGDDVYWGEGRPDERGRVAVVRRSRDGAIHDCLPAAFDCRTRVHEYGGGSFTVADGTLFAVNHADQRIYRLRPGEDEPTVITPDDGRRYADLTVDRSRRRVIAICEDPRGNGEPENTVVAVPVDGGEPRRLVGGHDFFASARVAPDGGRLAWLSWDHPEMPWDAARLWVGAIDETGEVRNARAIAGGGSESVFQPEWTPDGALVFSADPTGWWLPYRWDGAGRPTLLVPSDMEAEFGLPQWVFGMSTCAVLDADHAAWAFTRDGVWMPAVVGLRSGGARPLAVEATTISTVRAGRPGIVFLAGSPTEPTRLCRMDTTAAVEGGEGTPVSINVIRRSADVGLAPDWFPRPEPITCPVGGGAAAHAFFYPPRNPQFRPPAGERPPLIVMSHGGPTSATDTALRMKIAYWTSRGFAVLDVNYGGSTGYGRAYRERLDGGWGEVDVADCIAVARAVAAEGRADPDRMAITGGSAGGFTTLRAVVVSDVFRAGASYYGVSDPEALVTDTHKFESRYLDRLIGPYPERRDLYRARAPILQADRIDCPMIFFQGADDPVVPPDQSRRMVAALRERGIDAEYVEFAGESHGFRRADTIRECLDRELAFYRRVFAIDAEAEG